MASDDVQSPPVFQIGQVAERARLSLRTVRYYEEMGLIVPESRTNGGFRLYTEAHVRRLELIRRMKPLGFSVQDMRAVLDARDRLREDAEDEDARRRLAEFADEAARRSDDLAAKAHRGGQLVDVLRRESAGDVQEGEPPEFAGE
jgi:DNA-binding transcriptional MerR regulator